tara:strand:- start:93012 stop:93617 length:606 start_codon:yes stop_codon:yes gene_type:complete
MTEIQARYRVGNIIYVDFDRIPASLRPQGRMPAHDDPSALWHATEEAYLKAVDTPEQLTSESRAALVLALTKLLEVKADDDHCALLALRLATIELQMAITDCSEKPEAKRFFADQSLVQLQAILDYVGDEVHAIEDADQLVIAPTAIHMRVAGAHLLLGNERSSSNCMEFAEESLGRLDFEDGGWVRGKLLQQIIQFRKLS